MKIEITRDDPYFDWYPDHLGLYDVLIDGEHQVHYDKEPPWLTPAENWERIVQAVMKS